jgi:hypothetical protein
MVASYDGTGYSQIGYWNQNAGVPHRFFWQWVKNQTDTDVWCPPSPLTPPCVHTGLWGTPVAAVYHAFVVQREASQNGYVHVLYDGAEGPDNADGVHSNTSFDPLAGWWATPLLGEWFGEIHYYESDFPGTKFYRTNFSAVKVMNGSGNWVTEPFGPGWFGHITACFGQGADASGGGNTNFQIWTDPITRTHSGDNCS